MLTSILRNAAPAWRPAPCSTSVLFLALLVMPAGCRHDGGKSSSPDSTPGLPAAPGMLSALRQSDHVELSWTRGSTNEQGFAIERAADTTPFQEIHRTGSGATAHQDGGLTNGTLYRYRVRAFHAAGFSAYSNVAAVTAGITAWSRSFGGSADDAAVDVTPTPDGGYLVAGTTGSFGAGGRDVWLLKLDAAGGVDWEQAYGGGGDDQAVAVVPIAPGQYTIVGSTDSFGAGSTDVWALRVDGAGTILGQTTYGSNRIEATIAADVGAGGGVVIAGSVPSPGIGGSDGFAFELDASGQLLWQFAYGGNGRNALASIVRLQAGGYALAGTSLPGPVGLDHQIWALRLDAAGNLLWSNLYGGSDGLETAAEITETTAGDLVLSSVSASFTPTHASWVLRLNPVDGSILAQDAWQLQLPGLAFPTTLGSAVAPDSAGGYLSGAIVFDHPGPQVWVVQHDVAGNPVWQRLYTHPAGAQLASLQALAAGPVVLAGTRNLPGPDAEAWVSVLQPDGGIPFRPGSGSTTRITTGLRTSSSATPVPAGSAQLALPLTAQASAAIVTPTTAVVQQQAP
jgi:hypothetical protein